jgi:uncharacterized protein
VLRERTDNGGSGTLTVVADHSVDPERLRCLANDQLFLILMPTEACNFRCTYCYEDFRYSRMEPWVVEGVKRFISIRAPGLRVLEINWFGGEPLLATDIVENVSRHVQGLLRRRPEMLAKCGMTTNAFLLSHRRFERLLDLGIREYQVALDGPRRWRGRRPDVRSHLGQSAAHAPGRGGFSDRSPAACRS